MEGQSVDHHRASLLARLLRLMMMMLLMMLKPAHQLVIEAMIPRYQQHPLQQRR